ncbi:tRNA (cytidine/uridine-2'-O-)-methyltransferase [Alkalispirillum mobile]|uniref:tRNA (cytidine(34)-2'-O)-methyltransferase n=1 Tax=Alkalispirillum mobile TaxID=85925 RepID=A0A498BWZ2_9GAMM|nr:tRNA (cytidine(34)-2'-O)-methyltransferase [Alkalispirillum mobile]RLK48174.1 tRNA (cytidine/uridine-2'-O-)-methyltransferase [Alkalispirillum mobile]
MFHIVLVEPEIPGNTGNIIRLAANTGAHLHLIHPLGFELDDTRLRRAGLDYHEWARVQEHASLVDCLCRLRPRRAWALSTRGHTGYHQARYQPGDALVFGCETGGLRQHLVRFSPGRRLRLPMRRESRSMNLGNSVSVVLYEALRQHDFPELE